MTDALKNIFDADSMAAIKNAAEISPAQYTAKPVGNIVAGLKEPKTEENVIVYQESVEDNKEVLELREMVKHQTGVINRVIASQNEMIKELNSLQGEVKQLKSRPVASKPEEKPKAEIVEIGSDFEEPKPKKEKQQNGACNNLNPEDYCVENIFNFGRK